MDDSVMPTISREEQRQRSERYRKAKKALAESSVPLQGDPFKQAAESGHAAMAEAEREGRMGRPHLYE